MVCPLDSIIHELARAQDGVFSVAQARRIGFREDQIRHRRATGRWPLARPGIVRLPGAPATWTSELLAGCLLVGDRAVVSRTWAARLLGLDGVVSTPVPQFTARRGALHAVGGLQIHTTRTLDPVDLVTVRRSLPSSVKRDKRLRRAGVVISVRSTSASRTIIDLAASTPSETLGQMIDSACRSGDSSPAYLFRRLSDLRTPGRAGVTTVEEALIDSGGHSVLERRFLVALREAGLPRPTCQVTHHAGGRFLARVDFDFGPLPLVVEVAGRRGHSSDADRANDARRRNELQSLGITVLEFTYRDIVADPSGAVHDVAAHLRRIGLAMDRGAPTR